MTKKTLAALAAAATLALAGCGGADEPATAGSSASPSPSPSETAAAEDVVEIDVEIADGQITPRGERVEVRTGQEVRLRVTADVVDEIHVHSDPDVTLETRPGETVEETFTIDRPGQVAVESHESHTTIVQLVVRP